MIFLVSFAFIFVLATLALIDCREFRLPNALTLPLITAGFVQATLLGDTVLLGGTAQQSGILLSDGWQDSLLGAVIAYLGFVLIEIGFRHLRGKDGLGRGDAKLLAAGGAWCGAAALPFIILIASGTGLIALLLPSFRARSDEGRIPFGPFLAFAIGIVWLSGIKLLYAS